MWGVGGYGEGCAGCDIVECDDVFEFFEHHTVPTQGFTT